MRQNMYKIANRRLAANHFCINISGVPVEIISLRHIKHADISASPYYRPVKHRHTYYEAHIFLSGQQTYQVDNQMIDVQDSEIFCTSPHVYHAIPRYRTAIEKFAVCFTIGRTADGKEPLWAAALRQNAFFAGRDMQDITGILELIMKEAYHANETWYDIVNSLISILILKLARIARPDQSPSEHLEIMSDFDQRMISAEKFIRDNLVSNITASDVARFLHLSVRQLNRDISRKYGMTTKKYIDFVKYERALELLKEGTLTISQIGAEVGFPDRSDFHRFFKRMDGMAPGQYYR
ncbi:MAG: helix-turn-helix transcriptional regulator [Lachnospiraceae bacterium]|nr:helix-turn-helix transcriptional regulator [Lachnospiraceae bacterium]